MASKDFSPTAYAGPAHIPYGAVPRLVWGDRESGEVFDWTYVSTDKVHQLVFGLAPGGSFRHSDQFRTVFAADELYYVLSGTLVMNNPETGEVHVARRGEAVFFRRDTWHHGHSFGTEPLRVLEYFAPPPAQGTSRAYARTKPYLTQVRTAQDQWLGRWPMARDEAARGWTMRPLREGEALTRLEGPAQEVLVELFASTEHLTAGRMTLLPGRQSDVRVYAGDLAIYQSEGDLFARAGAGPEQAAFEVRPRDGFYVPAGVPVQFFNYGARPCRFLFGVAPGYLAAGA
jgi:mannose-6-phosphate isomerase-like protein (cupin superfamily)